jgi:hypothetical protein
MNLRKLAFALAAVAPAAHAQNPGAFLVAEFAAHHGDVGYAAVRMHEALDADPANTELRNEAFVLDLLARTPQAEELARTVPENPIAALLLATLAARRGDWQKAELGFAELPHDALTDAIKPLLMAWAQEAQGAADRAMDTLQPALTNGKFGAICLLHAALIADAAHRDGLAQRLYTDLSHAQTQPSLQFAQIFASWQARAGDMAGARATMNAATRNAPELDIAKPGLLASLDHPTAPDATLGMARAYVEVAAELRGQDHHDVADMLVQLALTLAPDLTDARLLASDIASSR